MKRAVPYITTKSGVRIGCAYQRPMPRVEGDAIRLQRVLLEPSAQVPEWLRLIVAILWRLL